MTTERDLKNHRTADLLAGLEGPAFRDDLLLRQTAVAVVKAPERRGDLLRLLVEDTTSPAIRRRIARYLAEVDLDLGDIQVLTDMLVRQSLDPDADLVRHLVTCVGPHARKHIPRSKCVAVIERLLDAPALDRHARVETLKALADVAEVHDIERLLARTYRSEEERALVGDVAQSVLRRPLFVRHLSPSAFEDLVCRVLEAREHRAGHSVRFRVCGRPYDGGVDGRGGDVYATGADDPGETMVQVQCKNTDRFSIREVTEFEDQIERSRAQDARNPELRESSVPKRIFVTAATPPDAKWIIREVAERGTELITGTMLVNMIKEFLGREASLTRE